MPPLLLTDEELGLKEVTPLAEIHTDHQWWRRTDASGDNQQTDNQWWRRTDASGDNQQTDNQWWRRTDASLDFQHLFFLFCLLSF